MAAVESADPASDLQAACPTSRAWLAVVVRRTAGGLRGESLAPLPVLATPTPSGAVHLLEGVAIGALVQRHYKGILRHQRDDETGEFDGICWVSRQVAGIPTDVPLANT
uniref:Uncharacterized protein n=1 Tax=Oryza nivara TaxID=4536 RepID=A0A0E0G3L5_ORYNI